MARHVRVAQFHLAGVPFRVVWVEGGAPPRGRRNRAKVSSRMRVGDFQVHREDGVLKCESPSYHVVLMGMP